MEYIYNISDSTTISSSGNESRPLHIPSLVSLIVFYFVILLLGILASWLKKSMAEKNSVNVMLAGRDMGLFLGIFTLTATWVGGGYINGTAQAVYKKGLVHSQAPFGYTLSLVISGLFFAKPMRKAGYVTMLDPFQIKFGRVMTAFLYIPALLGDVFWSASILSALGSTLYVITGLSHTWSVIISAAVAILYTFLGGLYSVAFTDVIQIICIFVGLWLVVPFAITHEAVTAITETAYSNDTWLGTLDTTHELGRWIDVALLLMLGGIPWQVYYQRILSQRTPARAQALSFVAAFGCFFLSIPAVIVGAVCRSTVVFAITCIAWEDTEIGKKPQPEMALPMVMQYLTPNWVAIIGLGAVSAAVMSSADSAMLSSSSMFARNVYAPIRDAIASCFHGKPASEMEVLIVMRIAVFFIGGASTVLAIVVHSVYDLFVLCSDLVYVVLFPQFLCVLHIPFTNTYGSLVGYIGGMFFRLGGGEPLLHFEPLIEYPYYTKESGQQFPFRTLSMLISLLLIAFVSLLAKHCFRRVLPQKLDIFKCMTDNNYTINSTKESTVYVLDKRENPVDGKVYAKRF